MLISGLCVPEFARRRGRGAVDVTAPAIHATVGEDTARVPAAGAYASEHGSKGSAGSTIAVVAPAVRGAVGPDPAVVDPARVDA